MTCDLLLALKLLTAIVTPDPTTTLAYRPDPKVEMLEQLNAVLRECDNAETIVGDLSMTGYISLTDWPLTGVKTITCREGP